MKQITITALLLAFATTLFAQTKETPFKKFYMDLGTGLASHNGVLAPDFAATAVLKNNWMASLSYSSLDMDPKNLPSDYEAGFTVLIFFPIPDEMPSVKMHLFNFNAGKFFPLGRRTWITTQAGLSIASGQKMSFTAQEVEEDGLHFSSNYSSTSKSQTTIGGALKADFNWAIIPYLGIGVGAYANVNSIQSAAGAEIKLIFGWLNTKKPKKS
jgi:hypothetical protein